MRIGTTLTAALLLWAGSARAAEIHGTLSTLLAGRQDPRAGDVVSVMPLYELVSIEVSQLGLPATDESRIILQGWGRFQFGEDELKDHDADLNLLYLDARKGPVRLRLGRQHLALGVARMALIDGANARFDANGVSAQGFFGATVHPELRHRTDNWQGGGRLAYNFADLGINSELGFGYIQRRQRGVVRRHDLGVDAFAQISKARIVGLAVVSPEYDNFKLIETRLAATWRNCDCLTFTIDGERVAPALLLPLNSIFSVFADVPHDAFGGDVRWTPSPYYNVDLDLHAMLLDTNYLGYRASLRATTYREASHRSLIGAEIRRLDEDENGYVRGRILTGLQLLDALRVSADLFVYWFDAEVNGIQYSTVGQASAVYDFTPSMRLAATIAGGVTPWAEFQVEGMLRFAYGFDIDLSRDAMPMSTPMPTPTPAPDPIPEPTPEVTP